MTFPLDSLSALAFPLFGVEVFDLDFVLLFELRFPERSASFFSLNDARVFRS